jgi:hypothetical protein
LGGDAESRDHFLRIAAENFAGKDTFKPFKTIFSDRPTIFRIEEHILEA